MVGLFDDAARAWERGDGARDGRGAAGRVQDLRGRVPVGGVHGQLRGADRVAAAAHRDRVVHTRHVAAADELRGGRGCHGRLAVVVRVLGIGTAVYQDQLAGDVLQIQLHDVVHRVPGALVHVLRLLLDQ